jgi:Ca2+-binding RTX toxin-like protein
MTIDLTGGGRSTGYASGDSLSGIATVIGSSGNDTFIGGTATGSSTMSGGGGTDWITYQYATSAATLDLTATSANGGSAQYDHVSGIENVRGSTYNDTFFADSVANSFIGGGGTGVDIVSYARGSAMTIDLTGGGRSTGYASGDSWSGIATVIGSAGNDTFIGGTASGSSTMVGGGGTDWITYQYATSAATLDLTAVSANGGSAANDHVSGIENVRGSTYNDTFFADSVANSFIGGGGTDIVSYARTATATVIDQTGGGYGTLYASGDTYNGIATIIGGTGNDTFIGGTASGSATMSGGGGTDWVSYQYAGSGATVDLAYNNTTSLNGGSAANDHLIGIRSIRGSAYNDTFYADSNANSFIGGGGTDIVSYARGTAMTINLTGTNRSTGLASGDSYNGIATVIGSSGNDTFIGGTASGSAVMSGGGGTDWVTYLYATGGKATVNLATGSNGGTAANDRLSGIENIVASNQGDVLTGNGNANSFMSGAGADTIDGGSGIDTVSYTLNSGTAHTINLANNAANSGGYAAGDVLTNIEVVIGGNSGDTITGNSSSTTTIIGGTGNDLFFGGSVGDSFSGGTGNDTVSYNNDSSGVGLTISLTNTANSSGYAQGDSYTSIETIIGTGFDDTFIGGTANGSATMNGAVGSDWISYAGLAAATVSLGGGTNAGSAQYDKLVNIENILGSSNADVLTGSTATNTINAGAGDDTIFGSGGSDSIDGGVGSHDIIDYSVNAAGTANDRAVTVYLGGFDEVGNNSSSHSVTMPAGYTGYGLNDLAVANTVVADYYANVEDVRGGGGNDILIGTTGINTIYGGSGNDTLGGGGGGDRLDGGGGTDTVTYAWESIGVSVYLGGTTQTGAAVGGLSLSGSYTGGGFDNGKVDYYASIENVVGSANKDFIVGSSGDNVITGYGGADTIYGMGGNDTIFGGLGSESIDGGSGTDTINYSTASGGVSVDLNSSFATSIGGVSFTDTLVSIENIVGSTSGNNVLGGNSLNNTIWGGTGSDTLWGGGGTADVLYGGTGNDTFFGGVGTETLNGEIGNDTVDYSTSTSGVSIDLTTGVGINLAGTTFRDTLVSIEAITGSNQADQISGNGTNWNIHGGGGNDTFTLSGIGTLDGGAGSDTLVFSGGDLHGVASQISNIEAVDLRNGTGGDSYSLTVDDIQHIVNNGTSSSLSLTIDGTDSFSITTSGTQVSVLTGNTYTIYSDNTQATQLAQLQLHQG